MLNQNKSTDPFQDTRIGLAEWDRHINSFGFGNKLGIDLPNEKNGLIPTPKYYDAAYNNKSWKFSNIYSLAIGEGENLVVPLQMANFVATVANRGFYYTPHLVKSIGKDGKPLPQYSERHFTTVDSSNYIIAVDAMQKVVESGTGQWFAKLPDIIVCGKTGTVQNEPFPDHSVFIAALEAHGLERSAVDEGFRVTSAERCFEKPDIVESVEAFGCSCVLGRRSVWSRGGHAEGGAYF